MLEKVLLKQAGNRMRDGSGYPATRLLRVRSKSVQPDRAKRGHAQTTLAKMPF